MAEMMIRRMLAVGVATIVVLVAGCDDSGGGGASGVTFVPLKHMRTGLERPVLV